MELMTKEIEEKLKKVGLYPKYDDEMDAEVLVKYFKPVGAATWLIIAGKPVNDTDWLLFGYVTLGYEWEWGYVHLSDLVQCNGPFGLVIERDLYCEGKTVRELCC